MAGVRQGRRFSFFLKHRQDVSRRVLEPRNGTGPHIPCVIPENSFGIGLHVRQVMVFHADPAQHQHVDRVIDIVRDEIENRMFRRMIIR